MFMSSWSASTDIYTLSLHDALPICGIRRPSGPRLEGSDTPRRLVHAADLPRGGIIALHPRRPRRPGHRLELTLMRILVSNDDGIFSPGIRALAKVAAEFGQVRVVAPDVEQSAMSHAITVRRPLHYTKTPLEDGLEGYRVDG